MIGDVSVLLAAGVLAGMAGSAGGIASLISYPVLLAVGLPAKPANVADTIAFVACLPGSALGSRPELQGQRHRILRLAPLAIAGSAVGATLLLLTPAGVFGRIVPFLVAFAAVALLVQPRASAWLEERSGAGGWFWPQCGLLAVWVFDGYWGVGAGVMALAVLTLAVETGLPRANALKNVLLGMADVACSIVFILFGPVRWAAVVPLGLGVLAGSWIGPSLTRRIPPGLLRIVVAFVGFGLALDLWLHPG
ncbi:MAG TPA: sulfite exporter TauE/SafE family protein [Trebonia sp.]